MENGRNDRSLTRVRVTNLKFQYNNVAALVGGYDQLIKNINTSITSQGWAEQQAKQQMDSINRQVASLKAQSVELFNVLNQAGATEQIKSWVSILQSIILAFERIRPETLAAVGNFTQLFVAVKAFLVVMRALQPLGNSVANMFIALTRQVQLYMYALDGVTLAQKKLTWTGVFTGLIKVANGIGMVVLAMSALEAVYDMANNKEKERQQAEEKTAQALKDNSVNEQTKLENMKQSEKQLERLSIALQKYSSDANDESLTQEQRNQALKQLSTTKEAFIVLVGKEAAERLNAAGWTQEAIAIEIEAFNKKIEAQNQTTISAKKADLEATQSAIENANKRIDAIKEEIVALALLEKAHVKPLQDAGINQAMMYAGFADQPPDADNYKGVEGVPITGDKKQLESLQKQSEELITKLEADKVKIQADISALIKPVSTDWDKTVPDKVSTSTDKGAGSRAEQLQRNALLARKNQLTYEAKHAATEYDTALKQLNNTEEHSGATYGTQIAKLKLYDQRVNELEGTKSKYKQFLSDMQAELDANIANNPELVSMTGYNLTDSDEAKQKIIAINKETFQSVKTLTTVLTTMDDIKNKIAEIDNQQEDLNKNKNSMLVKTDPESVYNQQLKLRQAQYNKTAAQLYDPINYNYDTEKRETELEYLLDLQEKYNSRIEVLYKDLQDYSQKQNLQKYQDTLNSLNDLYVLQAENANKIKDLEYEKTQVLKEGFSDVLTDFIVEGNSWKEIWKQLWKDLAKEAIRRLLQVKTTTSLLGTAISALLGGSSGNSSDNALTNIASAGSSLFGGNTIGSTTSHYGSNVSSFPKMHTGGDVLSQGRVGVVPRLKNDEVIRTLQVGEEVNSVSERRSNELMAMITAKALDTQPQQNINLSVQAMDSKLFASFLNENADVLSALMARQKAMNR